MRILADENFPRLAVEGLRQVGHDVLWARTDLTGEADDVILTRAQHDGRVVVTFDKDFGELAFRSGVSAVAGVVLFRLPLESPERLRERIVQVLSEPQLWEGHFCVVEESRVRIRPLPS